MNIHNWMVKCIKESVDGRRLNTVPYSNFLDFCLFLKNEKSVSLEWWCHIAIIFFRSNRRQLVLTSDYMNRMHRRNCYVVTTDVAWTMTLTRILFIFSLFAKMKWKFRLFLSTKTHFKLHNAHIRQFVCSEAVTLFIQRNKTVCRCSSISQTAPSSLFLFSSGYCFTYIA